MRDQLKLLEALQQHDARLMELDTIVKTMPAKLAAAQEALTELERILEAERAELLDTENFFNDQTSEQKDAEAQLTRAKAKLGQVRNMKENSAAQREMDSTRKQIDNREEEVGRLQAAMAEQRAKIEEQERKLNADREDLLRQQADMQRRIGELEGQLVEARAARETAAKALRPDALKKYNTILVRKRGLAVVAVRDGTCRGCNMNIPPQLYNILQRGTTLELCPNCARIIYWAKLLEEGDQKAG